jgi:hypothetical protein
MSEQVDGGSTGSLLLPAAVPAVLIAPAAAAVDAAIIRRSYGFAKPP